LQRARQRRKRCHTEEENKNQIFYPLCFAIFIEIYFIDELFTSIAEITNELMYRTKGTYPAAEKPPEDYRQDNNTKRTVQRPVKFMGR